MLISSHTDSLFRNVGLQAIIKHKLMNSCCGKGSSIHQVRDYLSYLAPANRFGEVASALILLCLAGLEAFFCALARVAGTRTQW